MTLPFATLPIQRAPDRPFLDLPTLLPEVLDLYPDWTEDDVRGFVEEKTGDDLHPEDLITLRAVYLRCYRLRRDFDLV